MCIAPSQQLATNALRRLPSARCKLVLRAVHGGHSVPAGSPGSQPRDRQLAADLITQFETARTVTSVLELLRENVDHSSSFASRTPAVQAAALRALARCLAPFSAAAEPDNSANTDTATVLEALTLLTSHAEHDLYSDAIPERLARAVMASGLEAGLGALCGTECPSGWATSACSTAAAAHAMADLVELLAAHDASKHTQATAHNESAESSSGGRAPPALSAAQAASLATVLITAGGKAPLPRPAALMLLALLSTEGALQRLPDWALEQALSYSLCGDAANADMRYQEPPLPLPDVLAALLEERMQAIPAFASDPVARASALRRCGAAGVWPQRALLQLFRDPAAIHRLSVRQTLAALEEMEACGLRERLAPAQRPSVRGLSEGEVLKRSSPDGPFASLTVELLLHMVRLTDGGQLGETVRLRDAAAALRSIAALLPRLEGASSTLLFGGVHQLVERTVQVPGPTALARMVQTDPAGLWAFLEAAFELGGQRLNTLMHLNGLSLNAVYPTVFDEPDGFARLKADADKRTTHEHAVVRELGPYFLDASRALKLMTAAEPLMRTHTVAFQAGMAGDDCGDEVDGAGGGSGLLTLRQLGLLYGLATLRAVVSPEAWAREAEALHRLAIRELRLDRLYRDALCRLSTRTDLPPLEHIIAVTEALEPAVVGPTRHKTDPPPPPFLSELEPLPLQELLARPLARLLADPRVAAERLPAGLLLSDDTALVNSPVEDLSEDMLLTALFAAAPTAAVSKPKGGTLPFLTLPLPEALRPPPGRRHGMPAGDAAGDAARESYVRSLSPWLLTARRLGRLVSAAALPGVELLVAAEAINSCSRSASQLKPAAGEGRWAAMVADAVDLSRGLLGRILSAQGHKEPEKTGPGTPQERQRYEQRLMLKAMGRKDEMTRAIKEGDAEQIVQEFMEWAEETVRDSVEERLGSGPQGQALAALLWAREQPAAQATASRLIEKLKNSGALRQAGGDSSSGSGRPSVGSGSTGAGGAWKAAFSGGGRAGSGGVTGTGNDVKGNSPGAGGPSKPAWGSSFMRGRKRPPADGNTGGKGSHGTGRHGGEDGEKK